MAAANVDLVLRGLLVHGVVKVDAVDVLQPPVLPDQEGPKAEEDEQHCGRGEWPCHVAGPETGTCLVAQTTPGLGPDSDFVLNAKQPSLIVQRETLRRQDPALT